MNYIIIKNISEAKIEQAVTEMAELYRESGFVDSVLLNRIENKHFMIEFPNEPDFERFAFFVNYLEFPESGYDDKPVVWGVWSVTNPVRGIDSKPGEKLVVYVSGLDTEHDNVSIENARGKVYKYSFSGKITEEGKSEVDYKSAIVFPEHATPLIEIVSDHEASKREVKPWWKFWA